MEASKGVMTKSEETTVSSGKPEEKQGRKEWCEQEGERYMRSEVAGRGTA